MSTSHTPAELKGGRMSWLNLYNELSWVVSLADMGSVKRDSASVTKIDKQDCSLWSTIGSVLYNICLCWRYALDGFHGNTCCTMYVVAINCQLIVYFLQTSVHLDSQHNVRVAAWSLQLYFAIVIFLSLIPSPLLHGYASKHYLTRKAWKLASFSVAVFGYRLFV